MTDRQRTERTPPETRRILIVEDQAPTREGVVRICRQQGWNVDAAFGSAEEALQWVEEGNVPDIVLTDLGLPEMSGVELICALKAQHPSIKFIVLTIFADDRHLFDALRAGATGYLIKDASGAQLSAAVAELLAGGAPMSSQIARRVIEAFHASPQTSERNPLSEREQQIVQALADGGSYAEVAARLCISVHTVQSHIKHIYAKLEVCSRTECINAATRLNLLRPR
jgi:DNA-binding NarL/FixJ family response regulator